MRVALAFVLLAACLGESPPQPQPTAPAPKLYKAPLPSIEVEEPAVPEPPDVAYLEGLEVRPAITEGRLSLVPILTVEPPATTPAYLTLQAGMQSGQVTVSDTGDIFKIVISNRSSRPLAILGGELVIGGQQDRLIVTTKVIPAGRTQVVATVCAEPGRMEGGNKFFPSHAIAEPTLRKLVRADMQLEVWDRIRQIGGASYRYGARQQLAGAHRERRDQLLAKLDAIERREERGSVVGFAVAIDQRVVAIERFPSAQLYRDLRGMLIASYLPSSAGTPRPAERGVGAEDVRTFAAAAGEGDLAALRNRATAARRAQ